MRPQTLQFLAVDRIPEAHRLILSAGSQELAVGTVGNVADDARVSTQFAKQLTVSSVPETDGLILAARRQYSAVRAEGDAIHRRGVAGKCLGLFTTGIVP